MASRAQLKKFVYGCETMTFNDLKKLVEGIQNLDVKSKVNPSLSRRYVVEEVFLPYFKNLEGKNIDLDSAITTTRFTTGDKLTLTSDGLIMLNILTECNYTPN